MLLCMLRCDVLIAIVFIDVVACYLDRTLRTILNDATCSDIRCRAFSWLCRPDHVHQLYDYIRKAGPVMMYRQILPVRCTVYSALVLTMFIGCTRKPQSSELCLIAAIREVTI
jgi:REP element-mobilizing transposase RayT